jgi:hypothetical protein
MVSWTLEFVFAEDSVVDEDAGEAVADGAVDEDGGDGGVDSAGEAADGVAGVADLFADGGDGGLDEVFGGPVGLALQMRKRKFLRSSEPCWVWWTSGWNWTAQMLRVGVGDAGDGVGGLGGEVEAFGEGFGFESPWDIQAVMVAGGSAKSGLGVGSKRLTSAWPYSRLSAGLTLPPRWWTMYWSP